MEKDFIEMLLFDAFIGQTDRHEENWGLIEKGKKYKLELFYDNTSSLGRNLPSNTINHIRCVQIKDIF